MVQVKGEIVIQRPVAEVFDVVVDERNEPRYNPNMLRAEKLTGGPVGVGTRFLAEAGSRGKPTAMTIEITGYARPERYTMVTRLSSMEILGVVTFQPVPEGTRMRWFWQVYPRGVYRLIGPLIGLIGRRQEEAIWAGLKRYLEARPTPLPAQAAR